jgi:hypothetical protein
MDQAITVVAASCLAASFQKAIYQTNQGEASSYHVAHSAAVAAVASVAVAKSGDVVVEGIYQMEEVAS